MTPLYELIVEQARAPEWYVAGKVPDTVDGRFDMVSSVVSLVLLRLEREGESCRAAQALLTETFVADMDGALRQMGVGDLMVGKHIGQMMGALGGRLDAYREALNRGALNREALSGRGDLGLAVRRNVFRDEGADADAVAFVEARLRALAARIDATSLDRLLAGEIA